jgi:predicted transcriptional regulator
MGSPTSLKLPDELKMRLATQAEAEGKTPHAYMLEALKEKADRADRRREYLAAGAASLKEYERTGIAYAMEDVERYILGVAAGKKPPRPKPIKASRSKS